MEDPLFVVLLLPVFIAVTHIVGLGHALMTPNEWDDCFGVAEETDNWVAAMRREDAKAVVEKAYKEYESKMGTVQTIEDCDMLLSTMPYIEFNSRLEYEEAEKKRDEIATMITRQKDSFIRDAEEARIEKVKEEIAKLQDNEDWDEVIAKCDEELNTKRLGEKPWDKDIWRRIIDEAETKIRQEELARIDSVKDVVAAKIKDKMWSEAVDLCDKEIADYGSGVRKGSQTGDCEVWKRLKAQVKEEEEKEKKRLAEEARRIAKENQIQRYKEMGLTYSGEDLFFACLQHQTEEDYVYGYNYITLKVIQYDEFRQIALVQYVSTFGSYDESFIIMVKTLDQYAYNDRLNPGGYYVYKGLRTYTTVMGSTNTVRYFEQVD